MSTLIAWPTTQTTANTATDSGTIKIVSSQEKFIAPIGIRARPPMAVTGWSGPTDAIMSLEPSATSEGMTAPAATSPLTLFSSVSATSSGFLNPGGSAAAIVSLNAHKPTSSSAGSQKETWANHGSRAFSSGVPALKYCQAPTPPTPSNGEMAIPVTCEASVASSRPGAFSDFFLVSAAGAGATKARQHNTRTRGANRFMRPR